MTIEEQLKGWGMDVEALKEEGAFLSPPKVPRAFSTNHPNNQGVPAEEWCYYAGMPSPTAYMDNS
jgi:hypothetical protein